MTSNMLRPLLPSLQGHPEAQKWNPTKHTLSYNLYWNIQQITGSSRKQISEQSFKNILKVFLEGIIWYT